MSLAVDGFDIPLTNSGDTCQCLLLYVLCLLSDNRLSEQLVSSIHFPKSIITLSDPALYRSMLSSLRSLNRCLSSCICFNPSVTSCNSLCATIGSAVEG